MKTLNYSGRKLTASGVENVSDTLTVEQALAVSVNGTVFTLTMQTPGNELELVRGLLFTEGVYKNRSGAPVYEIKEVNDLGYISFINVQINSSEIDNSQLNKRNLLSASSCGICGRTELQSITDKKLTSSGSIDLAEVRLMFDAMAQKQSAFMASGGCHAAAAFDGKKQMLCVMEDIGRHNAVDKVIGFLLSETQLKSAKYLLVSGRVSYEIVSKCFVAGIPFLLAVSAPSSLAVDFAKELGITLIGFCRSDRATVYSNAHMVI